MTFSSHSAGFEHEHRQDSFFFTASCVFEPEFVGLSLADQGRVLRLLCLAAKSPVRWVIQCTDETLISTARFGNEVHMARFWRRMIEERLFVMTAEGFWMPTRLLLPYARDYPHSLAPTAEESLKHFVASPAGSTAARVIREGAMTGSERQALKRAWQELAELALARRRITLPLEGKEKERHPAYEPFRAQFLALLRDGRQALKAPQIPAVLLDRLFPEPVAEPTAEADSREMSREEARDNLEMSRGEADDSSRDIEAVTARAAEGFESENESESHNNNSFAAESRETDPKCHEKAGVTFSGTEEEKAVVVALLSEKRKAYALSQAVAVELVERFGGPACLQQLEWLAHRPQLKPGQGTLAGRLRRCIEEEWPEPEAVTLLREEAERRAFAARQRELEKAVLDQAASLREASEARLGEFFASLDPDLREALETETLRRLQESEPAIYHQWQKASGDGRAAGVIVAARLAVHRRAIQEQWMEAGIPAQVSETTPAGGG